MTFVQTIIRRDDDDRRHLVALAATYRRAANQLHPEEPLPKTELAEAPSAAELRNFDARCVLKCPAIALRWPLARPAASL
jgi:hypothetical protein